MSIWAGGGETSTLHEPDTALLRMVLDAIPARVTIVGNDHRYIYVNREFLEFAGRSPGDVIGQHVSDVIGASAYRELAPLRARVQAGETVHRTGWLRYRDGEPRFVEQIFTPYRVTGQDIDGFFVFARDYTELKIRERELADQVEALKASEAANSAVIQSSLDCVIVMDEAGLVVEFNPAAEITFGYSRGEALGQSVADLIVPPSLRDRHCEGYRRSVRTGAPTIMGQRLELEGMRSTGEVFPVELTITELRLVGKRLFAAHLRDLTKSKAAQEEIERQRARLHQVEKLSAMGSLLAGVAHELNNPLAILLVEATLLQRRAETEDMKRRADAIYNAAARSGRIVKSFLAMARQKPPERGPTDLNGVILGAVEMTAYGRKSLGIELSIGLAPEIPIIEADSDMLGQVVANLLINAAQAVSERSGARRLWVCSAALGDAVMFEIADNGPGISPEDSERIFEPYYTTKPAGAGTGIGLTICRNVVAAHGGSLVVETRAGGGALFRATLPVRHAGDVAPASASRDGSGLSVLVVDDEPDLAAALGEMLRSMGHEATVAHGTGEALDVARRQHFDVVFADLRMPGSSGLELGRELQSSAPGGGPRVILVTGDTIAGPELLETRTSGDLEILAKPFTWEDVERALHQEPQAKAGTATASRDDAEHAERTPA